MACKPSAGQQRHGGGSKQLPRSEAIWTSSHHFRAEVSRLRFTHRQAYPTTHHTTPSARVHASVCSRQRIVWLSVTRPPLWSSCHDHSARGTGSVTRTPLESALRLQQQAISEDYLLVAHTVARYCQRDVTPWRLCSPLRQQSSLRRLWLIRIPRLAAMVGTLQL